METIYSYFIEFLFGIYEQDFLIKIVYLGILKILGFSVLVALFWSIYFAIDLLQGGAMNKRVLHVVNLRKW